MSKTLGQRLEDLHIEFGTAITIDWQHYRIQAAVAAMQGQLANDKSTEQMIAVLDYATLPEKTKAYMDLVAKSSVMLADALVEELKKGGQDD